MITRHTLFLFLFLSASAFTTLRCASERKETSLNGNQLFPVGRCDVADKKLELITSGSHFAVSFEGKSISIVTSVSEWQDHNYLQYELDGAYGKRLRVERGLTDTLDINADSEGPHTLTIYKATEAYTGPVYVHGLTGENLTAVQPSPKKLIEFIGNSITCGAAADASEVACGSGEYHDQHNAYYAYGPRVARALGADFILSSVSGIGVYRNWNSEKPIMPDVYEKADMQENSHREWDFKKFTPAIVSIALGTNDLSRGDGIKPRLPFDSAIFISSYVQFVKKVKSKYPSAKIALLSSPMVSGVDNVVFTKCLKRIKSEIDKAYPADPPASLFFFDAMQPRGCTYHPSVEDHGLMAEELLPFFGKLLDSQD